VVTEAVGLYPPAYATSRRLTGADDEIAGHRIPDGADVGVHPWEAGLTPLQDCCRT
jgi:cytochrome P450